MSFQETQSGGVDSGSQGPTVLVFGVILLNQVLDPVDVLLVAVVWVEVDGTGDPDLRNLFGEAGESVLSGFLEALFEKVGAEEATVQAFRIVSQAG